MPFLLPNQQCQSTEGEKICTDRGKIWHGRGSCLVWLWLSSLVFWHAVRQKIGPFAQPDFIQEAPSLPKTRSGKIMRRVLRKIAVGDRELGDISTMADESVVDMLFRLRPDNA